MQNHRLAERYAKSLIDLAIEFNRLDAIHLDILTLQTICKVSRDFVLMLDSPIIKHDKKIKIVTAVAQGKISDLALNFIRLLCVKGRESNLPEIINSFIDQYNSFKGIHKVKLTTALPVSDNIKNLFIKKIQDAASITDIQLEAKVDKNLIGGFVLEMDGKLVDASILRDLNDVKKQFANNDYIHKLR